MTMPQARTAPLPRLMRVFSAHSMLMLHDHNHDYGGNMTHICGRGPQKGFAVVSTQGMSNPSTDTATEGGTGWSRSPFTAGVK